MAYKTVYDDVIFIEGTDNRVNVKGNVKYKYVSFNSQLKGSLASQAKLQKCNCVVEFKYEQKSSWFSLDDTKWYGEGKCGILPEEDYT